MTGDRALSTAYTCFTSRRWYIRMLVSSAIYVGDDCSCKHDVVLVVSISMSPTNVEGDRLGVGEDISGELGAAMVTR